MSRRRTRTGAFLALSGALFALGCSSEGPLDGPSGGSSGGGSSAGGNASGGSSSVGGSVGGGLLGGSSASGGQGTTGGTTSGGSHADGGSPASGGRATGGAEAIGGAVGGVSAMGGGASGGTTAEAAGGAGGACPFSGKISYTLTKESSPTADQQAAYTKIEAAMSKAVEFYNCYTDISKAITAQYVPSVDTADGNPNGSIRFGKESYMNYVTAMHEISHVVGVGADNGFDQLIQGGVFTGPIATARLRELTRDPEAEIHGDTQHFWPYGLNYDTEWHSDEDGIFHCYIVTAILQDMGWQ